MTVTAWSLAGMAVALGVCATGVVDARPADFVRERTQASPATRRGFYTGIGGKCGIPGEERSVATATDSLTVGGGTSRTGRPSASAPQVAAPHRPAGQRGDALHRAWLAEQLDQDLDGAMRLLARAAGDEQMPVARRAIAGARRLEIHVFRGEAVGAVEEAERLARLLDRPVAMFESRPLQPRPLRDALAALDAAEGTDAVQSAAERVARERAAFAEQVHAAEAPATVRRVQNLIRLLGEDLDEEQQIREELAVARADGDDDRVAELELRLADIDRPLTVPPPSRSTRLDAMRNLMRGNTRAARRQMTGAGEPMALGQLDHRHASELLDTAAARIRNEMERATSGIERRTLADFAAWLTGGEGEPRFRVRQLARIPGLCGELLADPATPAPDGGGIRDR